jgi:hypothetical protein
MTSTALNRLIPRKRPRVPPIQNNGIKKYTYFTLNWGLQASNNFSPEKELGWLLPW